jgi:hypothetical protein
MKHGCYAMRPMPDSNSLEHLMASVGSGALSPFVCHVGQSRDFVLFLAKCCLCCAGRLSVLPLQRGMVQMGGDGLMWPDQPVAE